MLVDCVVAARCEFVLFTLKIVGDACVLKCARDLSEISPLIVLPGCYLKNLFSRALEAVSLAPSKSNAKPWETIMLT